MLEYWVLVTENDQGDVVSLYSPDLKRELLEKVDGNEEMCMDFRAYGRKKLNDFLESRSKIILPKIFEQLEDIPLTCRQHWEGFKVKLDMKYGVFEKTLPVIGHAFNVTSILTSLFITFMALKIAANNDNKNDSTQSTALAICGSIFNSLIIFFLYVLSDASNALLEVGYSLDNLFRKSDAPLAEGENLSPSKGQAFKFIIISLIVGGSILTNALIVGIRQYIEFGLINNKFLKLDPGLSDIKYEQYYSLIKWLDIVPNIIATTYCAVAFQGSFARKLIMKFSDKPTTLEQQAIQLGGYEGLREPLLDNAEYPSHSEQATVTAVNPSTQVSIECGLQVQAVEATHGPISSQFFSHPAAAGRSTSTLTKQSETHPLMEGGLTT